MPIVFGPAAAGALILLRCPKCGEVQARARAPQDTRYMCRKCHHAFVAKGAIVPFSSRR